MTPPEVLTLLFETEASGLRVEGLTPAHLGEETFSELILRRVFERHSDRLQDDPALSACLIAEALLATAPEALRALAAEARTQGHLGFAEKLEEIAERGERDADQGPA
jgi:hypothetical protein